MTLALRWAAVRAILLFHYGTDAEIWVSTESWPWRRIVFCRSWWDSNPQPFNLESSALPLSYPSFITQALSVLRHPSKPNHPHKYREEEKHGTEFLKTHYLGLFLPTTEPACMFVYVTVPNRNSIRMVACLFAYVHVCVRTCICVLCLCVRVCAHMRLVCVCCGLSVCLCMCLHVYIQY